MTFLDHNDSGAYDRDRPRLIELGLRTDGFGPRYTDLGTVTNEQVPEWQPGTSVKVEVNSAPAQFWRFTITRPADGGSGIEHRIITTGSGAFSDFWPAVSLVAGHMLGITDPDHDLAGLVEVGKAALYGTSNDREHDALHEIVSALEAMTGT